jgi:hypothetical protein
LIQNDFITVSFSFSRTRLVQSFLGEQLRQLAFRENKHGSGIHLGARFVDQLGPKIIAKGKPSCYYNSPESRSIIVCYDFVFLTFWKWKGELSHWTPVSKTAFLPLSFLRLRLCHLCRPETMNFVCKGKGGDVILVLCKQWQDTKKKHS